MDLTTRKQIANTILDQMGGREFLAMTGAKHPTILEDGSLAFRLPGVMIGVPGAVTRSQINRVTITLDPSDTYTMRFERIRMGRNPSCKCIYELTNLYDDTIRPVFERTTGLATRFPRFRSATA